MNIKLPQMPDYSEDLLQESRNTGNILRDVGVRQANNERSQFMQLVSFVDNLPGDLQKKWFDTYGNNPRTQELALKYLGTKFIPTKQTSAEILKSINDATLARDTFTTAVDSKYGQKGAVITGLEAREAQLPVNTRSSGNTSITPSEALRSHTFSNVAGRMQASLSAAKDYETRQKIISEYSLQLNGLAGDAVDKALERYATIDVDEAARLKELVGQARGMSIDDEERDQIFRALAKRFHELGLPEGVWEFGQQRPAMFAK